MAKSYLSDDTETGSVISESETVSEDETKRGYVQISGAVKYPGVYEISGDIRLFEVIEMAGGFTEDAASENVNQVQEISDGESIHIPTIEELTEDLSSSNGQSLDGRININSADINMLMTLSGIGESKAKQIINYRETKGSFKSIEEIMNIQGIKEGVFNKIKDEITVG